MVRIIHWFDRLCLCFVRGVWVEGEEVELLVKHWRGGVYIIAERRRGE